MSTLFLPLKKKWFDMIKAGTKLEEYREIKAKYIGMFCQQFEDNSEHGLANHSNNFMVSFHLLWPEEFREKYDTIVFTLAYPKRNDTENRLTFKSSSIRIDYGKPEWGAEPGKLYFVITWSPT